MTRCSPRHFCDLRSGRPRPWLSGRDLCSWIPWRTACVQRLCDGAPLIGAIWQQMPGWLAEHFPGLHRRPLLRLLLDLLGQRVAQLCWGILHRNTSGHESGWQHSCDNPGHPQREGGLRRYADDPVKYILVDEGEAVTQSVVLFND